MLGGIIFINDYKKGWAKFLCPIFVPTGFLDKLTDCKDLANLSIVDNMCDDVMK